MTHTAKQMQSQDASRVSQKIETDILQVDGIADPPGYAHIALALIDAVFSIRARYSGVRRVVTNYCLATGTKDQALEAVDEPGFVEHKLPDFLDQMRTHDDLFATNRGKTAGRLKSEVCVDVAERLVARGIESRKVLMERFEDPAARDAWVGTKGLGWITWQYFGSLNGLQQVKPDIHVVAFVNDALERFVSPEEADGLVRASAAELGIPIRSLEHSIWRLGSKWDLGSPATLELTFAPEGDAITFTVPGRPPSKAGAGSPLGAGSNHRSKTLALLEAARDEIARTGFRGFGSAPVRLEVEVRTGPGEAPWDATNLLGGIADVLDSKAHKQLAQPGMLEHLGELADVALYDDDRQIQEVSYRVIDHPDEEYVITITAVD